MQWNTSTWNWRINLKKKSLNFLLTEIPPPPPPPPPWFVLLLRRQFSICFSDAGKKFKFRTKTRLVMKTKMCDFSFTATKLFVTKMCLISYRFCAWSRHLDTKWILGVSQFNTLRPRQDGRRFPDDIFKWLFLNEIIWISIKISLNFFPMALINNIPALVQIMAWRRPGDKPLSEPMIVRLTTHICVTRPQWVKTWRGAIWPSLSPCTVTNPILLT